MSESLTIALVTSIIAMFGWGITDIFSKKAITIIGDRVSTLYFMCFNFVFAFPLLFFDSSFPVITPILVGKMMLFSIADFFAFIFLFRALEIGKVSVVVPITSGWAVLAAIISFFLFTEPMPFSKILLVILAVSGIIFVSINLKELRDGFAAGDLSKGVWQGLAVFIIYGIYIPFWTDTIQTNNWVWLTIITRLMSAVLIAAYVVRLEGKKALPRKAIYLPILLILGASIFQSIGANAFGYGLAKSEDTTIVAAISSGYPAVLAVMSYIFLKERLAVNQYFGIAMIVAAICLIAVV